MHRRRKEGLGDSSRQEKRHPDTSQDENENEAKLKREDREFDSIKNVLERKAERAGKKWIIIPTDTAVVSITFRRVSAGEEFDIYTLDRTIHFKSNGRGWKEFVSSGLIEWKGRNPDLYCDQIGLLYLTDYLDSLQLPQ